MSRQHERKHRAEPAVVDSEGRTTAGGAAEQTATPARPQVSGAAVVVPPPENARARLATAPRPLAPARRERGQVRVAPNVLDLVTIPAPTPQATDVAREQRDLNKVVHAVLIVGLAISTVLMLAGVGLALLYQRDLPTAVPDVGEVLRRVAELRPSGFLALGLLVLIATPILRVVGSIIAFIYEHDWRYAGITAIVLLVLIVSLILGKG